MQKVIGRVLGQSKRNAWVNVERESTPHIIKNSIPCSFALMHAPQTVEHALPKVFGKRHGA